ncbi:hypothetical protein HYPSUDRAFT_209716 [Hypholoma sublateritium FD-334 SS-4]|uniref:Uncharacterized protein n=1 Tax=Hypholoma sublateritium (strain FD-334 SS-4) TaxID=945553 RepID=A0A0D2N994_HYPSF|nr:hypothetical protein HYPSUDRAFT_209716 [Hypholoma sublateritium FD-334 SS-4]
MPNFQEYQFQSLLRGAVGPINSLLFSVNGSLLLAGGDDAKVKIWNTTTCKLEGVLANSGKWGQITCLTWLYIDKPIDNKSVALAVGTGRGNITLCPFIQGRPTISQSRTFTSFDFNDAVEAMSFDRINSRLAISSHSGQIKVVTVSTNLGLQPLWQSKVDAAIPRALFLHGANNSLLMTLSLETGELEADSGSRLWAKPLEGAIFKDSGGLVRPTTRRKAHAGRETRASWTLTLVEEARKLSTDTRVRECERRARATRQCGAALQGGV